MNKAVQYLETISRSIDTGDFSRAIKFLNSPELRPVHLAETILQRSITAAEKPYFFNQCPEYAPDSCKKVARIVRRMRDCHQTARRVLRELSGMPDEGNDSEKEYIQRELSALKSKIEGYDLPAYRLILD